MANPLPAFPNVNCDECDEEIPEGDSVYFHDDYRWCKNCADEINIVCGCGKYKKPQFRTCFNCK